MKWLLSIIMFFCIIVSFYFIFGGSLSYYWRYDWRLNDLKNSKFFMKRDLKVRCFSGLLYYTYSGTSYCIPVLDKNEKLIKCAER
jgi:hypothetical protein